ncbi:MAG: hypothetical protein LUE92_01965 [Clostridiales bacterium]|nr:hypothetical protein [Clostridiales bacterium]
MIMDLLYRGLINPLETVRPQDEQFLKGEEKANDLYEDLLSRLNGKDQKQLEELRDTLCINQGYEEEERFRYGLALGVMLMQEIYEIYSERYFREQVEKGEVEP